MASNEFADLPEALIIARGTATFAPDDKFDLDAQDIGEADVSRNTANTFTDVKSRKHLVRITLKRKLDDSTSTITITCYQRRKIVEAMKNMAAPKAYVQEAATALPLPAGVLGIKSAVRGQIIDTGKVGIGNVALKKGTAAQAADLVEGVDIHVIGTSGKIEFLKDVAFDATGLSGTFDCMPYSGIEFAINSYTEITGYLTVQTVAEADEEAEEKRWYVGVAVNGDLTEITGDDGETGWAFEARVLADVGNPGFTSGRSRSLPSLAAVAAAFDEDVEDEEEPVNP